MGFKLKFTRAECSGDPCWQLSAIGWAMEVDWNIRLWFPSGFSAWARSAGKNDELRSDWSVCLDLNAPLGEPNRLYWGAWGWFATLGLPSLRTEWIDDDNMIRHGLSWPHIDGCDRYRYHRDEEGKWVRNDRPEPGHWGWLTVHRA